MHEAVVSHRATGAAVLHLRAGDVFWCTADPGWVTGTSYWIIAPLTLRATCIVDEAELEVDRWYGILQDERVTVWYTAPTALRMLMRAGAEVAHEYDLTSLRFIASVGEPLNSEVVMWGQTAFGLPVHDNWWADRNRWDHDRQLPVDGHPARIDGSPVTRDRGGGGQA